MAMEGRMGPTSLWFPWIWELKRWRMLKDRRMDRLADASDLLEMGHLFLSSRLQNVLSNVHGASLHYPPYGRI